MAGISPTRNTSTSWGKRSRTSSPDPDPETESKKSRLEEKAPSTAPTTGAEAPRQALGAESPLAQYIPDNHASYWNSMKRTPSGEFILGYSEHPSGFQGNNPSLEVRFSEADLRNGPYEYLMNRLSEPSSQKSKENEAPPVKNTDLNGPVSATLEEISQWERLARYVPGPQPKEILSREDLQLAWRGVDAASSEPALKNIKLWVLENLRREDGVTQVWIKKTEEGVEWEHQGGAVSEEPWMHRETGTGVLTGIGHIGLLVDKSRWDPDMFESMAKQDLKEVHASLDRGGYGHSNQLPKRPSLIQSMKNRSLFRAVENKWFDSIEVLLAHGADPCGEVLGQGRSTLFHACSESDTDIVRSLLSTGKGSDTGIREALEQVAGDGNMEMANILIPHISNREQPQPYKIGEAAPLYKAAKHGRKEMVGFLLNNMSFYSREMDHALNFSIALGDVETVARLLAKGTVPSGMSVKKAITAENQYIVRQLVEAHAPIDQSVVQYAESRNLKDIANYLKSLTPEG